MISRRVARWRGDQSGVAAVEFAFCVPVLLVVCLGGYEITQAMATYRKVSDTTVELANVTAQYTTMSATDVNSVFNASAQVMSPFSTTPLAIVLSEIQTDASSNAKVAWSCSFNGATALTVGASVTMPTGLASPSSYYILVQTSYQYTPTVGASFVGAFPMTDQIYMIPRSSPSIPNSGC